MVHENICSTFRRLQKNIARVGFGKKIGSTVYLFIEDLSLGKENYSEIIEFAEQLEIDIGFNVIKVDLRQNKISFLSYPDFLENPHPSLNSSVAVDLLTGAKRTRDFSESHNPPILHRKELLVGNNHPKYVDWKALTEAEEAQGLYDNTKVIGFRKNWEALLEKKGLAYDGHRLVRKSGGSSFESYSKKDSKVVVKRHKTAIKRYAFSKPLQTAIEHDLIKQETTVFDYGCGRRDDLRGLEQMGIQASGWDPVYLPNSPKKQADVVNLGFVLNVIEDQNERIQVLRESCALANQLLIVSSMIASSATASKGRPYKDGILTSRNTFQKYFQQSELAEFIEKVLRVSPVAVGLGIFYIFQNRQDHQTFLAKRSRRRLNWDSLHRRLYGERPTPSASKRERLFEEHGEVLEGFWRKMLKIGRLPSQNELGSDYAALLSACGSLPRAKRFVLDQYGEDDLVVAAASRTQDILVYLALANFKHNVPWRELPEDLKLNIKAFFGNYKNAQSAGQKALFAIGNPDVIFRLCDEANLGYLDQQALYLHRELITALDPVLRIYIGVGEMLYGDAHIADIIKIHKRSGKVTFLIYDKFEKSPLPELIQRVKVNLRSQRVDVFEQEKKTWQQLLYFKERFVAKDHPLLSKWEKYSLKLRKIGLHENMGLGPSKEEFLAMLEAQGLTLHLNKKRK
jgi:DNA phosphorothioation-associated putative methyltransferase